jgi:signal transduction histidine kinase
MPASDRVAAPRRNGQRTKALMLATFGVTALLVTCLPLIEFFEASQRVSVVQLIVIAVILASILIGGVCVARAFVRMQHEFENRNRELDAFAGRIAHDLRSPLNSIGLETEFLATNAPASMTSTARIRRSIVQIARLIDDLLVLSRTGVMPRTVVRTEPIGFLLREDLEPLVIEAHGVLRVDLEPAQVMCTRPCCASPCGTSAKTPSSIAAPMSPPRSRSPDTRNPTTTRSACPTTA